MAAHSLREKVPVLLLVSGLLLTPSRNVLAYRPEAMPGWPKVVQSSSVFLERCGPSLADVDGNGSLDILVGTSEGTLWVWDYQGNLLPGWPQSVPDPGMIQGVPVPGDVNADGQMDVVACVNDSFATDTGFIYVWNSQGQLLPGWPQALMGWMTEASLSDPNSDGTLEVLVAIQAGDAIQVEIRQFDGTALPGWPQPMGSRWPCLSPSVGDIDNDGQVEIVAFSSDSLCAWEADGTRMNGWPVVPASGYVFYGWSSPALADFDRDGDLEIVVVSYIQGPPFDGYIHVYDHAGKPFRGWSYHCVIYPNDTPAIGDVDGDHDLEIVISTHDYTLHALDLDKNTVLGWPFSEFGLTGCYPILGDLDGDDNLEIITGDNRTRNGGRLHAFDHDGTVAACWPLGTIGFTAWNSAVLGDVEPNNTVNMVNLSVSWPAGEAWVWLWELSAPYDPDKIEWECLSHDIWHTGCYGFQVPSE